MLKKSLLKNWAVKRLLQNFSSSKEIHIKNRREADKRLDLLCRMAIIRAGIAGLLSGLIVIFFALLLRDFEFGGQNQKIIFAVVLALIGFITTGIELAFLYRDSLTTASRMAKVIDLPQDEIAKMDVEHAIGPWLIYAALGAPGYRGTLFGIDPLEKIGKLGLLIRKLLKKIGSASSFTFFKAILRRIWVRIIGRVATRAYVELLALPIFILFNIIGMKHTMSEMRSRLVGHELTPKLIEHTFPEGLESMKPGLRRATLEGLIERITAARYLHPNQIRVLEIFGDKWDNGAEISKIDQRRTDRFLVALSAMSGKDSRRCKKLNKLIIERLGKEEVKLVKKEVFDAIHDLTPFNREWV
tara:strand:- start:5294 stop:6364 length:1071 start_codon:yes stop_codon:yes gene_type:complete